MTKKIEIKCQYDKLIKLENLFSIQENLKIKVDIKRLKKAIINNGFIFPVYVWQDPSDCRYKLIDGYHRRLACQELVKDGYDIPALPAISVDCSSYKEAKEYVLRATSRYSTTTKDKFNTFVEESGLNMAELAEELSHKDFGFVKDLLIEEDDFEEIDPKEATKVRGGKPEIVSEDMEYIIFQIVFDTKDQQNDFWALMTRIKNYEYKHEDNRDILFDLLQKECAIK